VTHHSETPAVTARRRRQALLVDQRWAANVIEVPGGCAFWVGAITTTGYGRFWRDGRAVATHREAWRRAHGDWPPPGTVVRHTCDETSCVRRDHLILGTAAQNTDDLMRRGRWAGPGRRGAGGDVRGPSGRARAIRAALLEHGPDLKVLSGVMAVGDPRRGQLPLPL